MKKIWLKDGKFVALDAEQIKTLEEDALIEYHQAKLVEDKKKLDEIEKNVDSKASKEEIVTLVKSVNETRDEIMLAVQKQGETLAELARKGGAIAVEEGSFEKVFADNADDIKAFKAGTKRDLSLTLAVKAVVTQTYGDIDAGLDFAQMRPGIVDQPVRRPRFKDLFSKIPLKTQFLKYVEQDSVARDAQNVANCTAITTSLTKETLLVSNIEAVKIKDMIKVCIDFLDDYSFMRSRINRLLNQSVTLRVDQQVLLGTGIAPETNSIDSVSSEFNAANPVGVLTTAIQDANYVDLIMGMRMQIIELGQQNSFNPDVVVVNAVDWFKLVESKKDANNNYLDTRVIRAAGGNVFVGGMLVVTSPIVVQNTCYVFDSTQGEIIDRQEITIDLAFENGTDWESDLVSMKGSERLNLLVPNEVANAFMKCSDVATAITAITSL